MYYTPPKLPYISHKISYRIYTVIWTWVYRFIHQPPIMLTSRHHIHSEQKHCKTNVSQWSTVVFSGMFLQNNVKQIVLIYLWGIIHLEQRTQCCFVLIFTVNSLCSSQAAAMEASSSCRPWGWGQRIYIYIMYYTMAQCRVLSHAHNNDLGANSVACMCLCVLP